MEYLIYVFLEIITWFTY